MMLVYKKPDRCAVCASPLQIYLTGVEDRVYGVAGRWNLDRCVDPACGVIYLAHDLTGEQLASFYASYSTHASPVIQSRGIKRVYREALASIRQRRLDYPGSVDWLSRLVGTLLDRVNFFRANALGRVFWLPYRPGGEVIEVGFGNAQTLYQLREAGWSVRGSEFDQTCIDQARALGLDAVQGNFADGLFAAASADAVVASHTIEHLTDPGAFIREAYRVLRPGGMLVLATPNAHSRDALKKGKDWRGLEVPRHLSIHTPGSLARMAKDANFIDVEVTGTPLSGFILQQSDELAQGQTPSTAQSRKTWRYNVEASLMTMRHDQDSDEIVLRCVKP